MKLLSFVLHFAFALFVATSSVPPCSSPIRPQQVETTKHEIDTSATAPKFNFFNSLRKRGVGFSFVKSLTSWKQFGVGVKFPVSAHFPNLEKKKFMPKVTSFIGVLYPQGIKQPRVYRLAVTTSYSLEPILLGNLVSRE